MVFRMVNAIMNTKVTMDGAGRVVLPKPVRDRLRLRAGAELELELQGDYLTLRPVALGPVLANEDGWWVHRGEAERGAALEDAVDRHRRERIEDLSR
jgi:AbrB family looped-hinge helix DNA binding protein